MASIRELKQRKKELEQIKGTEDQILEIEKQIEAQTKKNAENAKKRAEADKEALKFKTALNKADTKARSLAKDVNKLLKSQKIIKDLLRI